MKRLPLLTGAAALCALALMFAIFCTEVTFDNPLDEKEKGVGTGYEWLWTITPADCQGLNGIPPGVDCGAYIRSQYFNPGLDTNIKKQWDGQLACVGKDELKIELEGSPSVVLYTNQSGEFQRLVNQPWNGIVKYTEGADVRAVLTRSDGNEYPYDGLMPPPGFYIIRYTASKLKCGSNDPLPPAIETRQLEVKEYIPDDVASADIYFCPGYPIELTEGTPPFNELNCVTKVKDETLTRTINGGAEEPLGTISTAAVGTFTIAYKACRTRIVNDNPVPSCTTVVKTVTVKKQQVVGEPPTPVIVLNTYTYIVDGQPFVSPAGVLDDGEQYVELGVSRVFYLNESGVEIQIDKTLVKSTPPASFSSNVASGAGGDVVYVIEASGAEYGRATVTRKVYRLDGYCYTTAIPTITFRKPNPSGTGWANVSAGEDPALSIPPRKPWNDAINSVSVSGVTASDDGGPFGSAIAYRLGADFGNTFNSYNPQPGNYTITYVALSPCAGGGVRKFFRSAARPIIVSQQ